MCDNLPLVETQPDSNCNQRESQTLLLTAQAFRSILLDEHPVNHNKMENCSLHFVCENKHLTTIAWECSQNSLNNSEND